MNSETNIINVINTKNIDMKIEKKSYKKKSKNSYGVICYTIENDKIYYLMVKRRFTYSFFDFLMGNYNVTDIFYIKKLISRMTIVEKKFLTAHLNFDVMWNKLWGDVPFYKYNYEMGLIKYNLLKKGFINGNNFINLRNILKNNINKYKTCEWGFPKGKKEFEEEDIFCAIREFEEESGIEEWELVDISYIYEKHVAINNKFYKTDLYFIKIQHKINLDISKCDKSEISDLYWFTKEEIFNELRDYQSSIKNAIEIADRNIKNYYRINKVDVFLTKIKNDYIEYKNTLKILRDNKNIEIIAGEGDLNKKNEYYDNMVQEIKNNIQSTDEIIKKYIIKSYIDKSKIQIILN